MCAAQGEQQENQLFFTLDQQAPSQFFSERLDSTSSDNGGDTLFVLRAGLDEIDKAVGNNGRWERNTPIAMGEDGWEELGVFCKIVLQITKLYDLQKRPSWH